MTREQSLELLKQNLSNQNLIKHCLAVEAVMRALAHHFNEDENKWGLAGLLHDIDYEKTKNDSNQHSIIGAQMLGEAGLDKETCQAVRVHNEIHGFSLETLIDKALFTVDPLTGLIVAATLVLPSKKITDLTTKNVLNRFPEKSFARGADREIIKKCEELLNIKLERFVDITLKAMQQISDELGL
ncbi:HDIG domain-containing metalloprotein [Patescibacteria group bacterium]